MDLIDLKDAEGEHLYLWHLPPYVEGAPVMVFFDGVRGNLSVWNRRWRRIAAYGAGVVAISYRGYGGSTGIPSQPGLVEDAWAAWEWAREHYDESQLVLHGYSMGSAFAVRLGAENPKTKVILEGAPLSIRKEAKRWLPFLWTGLSIPDDLSVIGYIERIKGGVLIAHGNKDLIVPPSSARKLYRKAREPKKLEFIENGNHTNLSASGLYSRIWSFLEYDPPQLVAELDFAEDDA